MGLTKLNKIEKRDFANYQKQDKKTIFMQWWEAFIIRMRLPLGGDLNLASCIEM